MAEAAGNSFDAALPAVLGLWCCERPPVGNDNNDQALSLLWSALSLSFIAVLCAAMLGVRDKVCDSDVERASNDALSLLVSCAPAGHAGSGRTRRLGGVLGA